MRTEMACAVAVPAFFEQRMDDAGVAMVIERDVDGWFNATAMCGDKGWRRYKETKNCTETWQKIANFAGVGTDELARTINRGRWGTVTWVYGPVAMDLAAWISNDFKAFMAVVMHRFITGQITTEESKQMKARLDEIAPLQKRLNAAERNLAVTEGRLKGEKEFARRLRGKVDAAESQATSLEGDLKRARKLVTNKDREKAKLAFVKNLRQAIAAYARDRTVSSPEAEDGFGEDLDGSRMTIPKFVQGLEEAYKYSSGLGREWTLFGETPGDGWNIIPIKRADDDKVSVEDFCKHSNFVAGFNHPDKKNVLIVPGDEMHAAPVSKRGRRC